MIEDRKLGDDERYFARGQFFNKKVAVRVLAVEDGEMLPAAPGLVQALEFVGYPGGFGFGGFEFDDADSFAFGLVGFEDFLGEFGTALVHSDGLRGYAQDVGRRAVVFGESDAIGGRILSRLPAGEAFEEQLEAAERGAAKTVDGLIVVTDDDDAAGVAGQEMQQFELGDVGVLKFVHENVLEALLEVSPTFHIVLQKRHSLGDEAVDGHAALFAQDLFVGAVGTGDFLLQGDVLSALLRGVSVECTFLGFELGRKSVSEGLVFLARDQFILATGEKSNEVTEELSGLGEATVFLEPERARLRRSRIQWSTDSSGRRLGATSLSSVSQKEWKVARTTSFPRSPTAFTTRAFISPAAFFVKVRPRMFSPSREESDSRRWRMRSVMTRVFPVPAPAITRSGPSPCVMTRRWDSFGCSPPVSGRPISKSVVMT